MKLLTVKEVHQQTGLSEVKIRSLIAAKKLPAIDTSTGKRPTYLIRQIDLDIMLTPAEVDCQQARVNQGKPKSTRHQKPARIDAHVPNVFGKENREKLKTYLKSKVKAK